MKNIVLIIVLVLMCTACVTVYGAAITATSKHELQNGRTMFKLPAFNDGDTFTATYPVAGWWVSETNNPDTQTEADVNVAATVSGTTTTFTFYPARNGATANFFIAR